MVLVPELAPLVLALVCLALALLATLLIEALINAMGGVPVIGSAIRAILSPVARAITWAAGQLERGVDALIGWSFNLLAKTLDYFWHQFTTQAALILHLAEIVGNQVYNLSGLRSLVHRLEKLWHGVEHGVRDLTRKWHGIERRVKALEREITQGIGHDLRIEVAGLEKELGRVETKVIPGIRSIAQTAENDVTALQRWIAANVPAIGTEAFAGAVAIALTALGLGGLRCNSLLGSLKNRGCGLWNGLESLLGMFVDLFIITDLCDLIGPLETAFSAVAAPAIGELTAAIDSMPCVAGHQPPTLAVPALALPPNPGVTLSLP